MGRRRGGNKTLAPCSSQRNDSSKGINEFDTEMSAVGSEDEVVMAERTESSNLEDGNEALALVGSDQTSADYYFDSYSHFGEVSLL